MIELIQDWIQLKCKLQLCYSVGQLDQQNHVFGVVAQPVFEFDDFDTLVGIFCNVIFE